MEASRCGKVPGEEMALFCKKQGYDGIFITDHFFNGSSAIDKDLKWEEKVALFCSGYESAKAAGDKIGLDVFFGLEFNVAFTEFLVYGIDKEWLLAHPDADKMSLQELSSLVRGEGGFIVHAHPFRQRPYIKCIRLLPDYVDAVEAVNAAHPEGSPFNDRAKWYASEFGLPVSGGSDNHINNPIFLGGIYTEEKIKSWQDYKRLVNERRVTPFMERNPFYTIS